MNDGRHLLHIGCGGCTAAWAGEDRAHCASCHETWESVALYDEHRTGGACARPRALGLVATKNRIWQRR